MDLSNTLMTILATVLGSVAIFKHLMQRALCELKTHDLKTHNVHCALLHCALLHRALHQMFKYSTLRAASEEKCENQRKSLR